MAVLYSLRDRFLALLKEEDGQGTFEYFMVVGAVVVAIVGAAALLAWDETVGAVAEGMCQAIEDTLNWTIADCSN